MKYLLLLCFLYSGNAIKAQNSYRINYSHFKYFADSTCRKGVCDSKFNARLVYNDSISFYYMLPKGSKKDKLEKLSVLGDKVVHHGLMFDSKRKEILHEVTSEENSLLIVVPPSHFNWVFSSNTKSILGNICSLAYSVNEVNDSTMVWYSNKFGKGFGPADVFGLPGIALEVFDQRNDSHYVAEKIELTSVNLVLPQNVKRSYPPKKPQQ